jgi:hypothetical protein
MYGSHRQGMMPLAPRARAVLLIGILGLAALAFGLLQQSDASAAPKPKVTICHATGSATNPFVQITISQKAVDNGHAKKHNDDIIPAPAGGCPDGPGGPGGGGVKVDVCHLTGSVKNPVVLINISENAVQAHLDHGDFLADAVTGCTVNPDPDPDPVIDPVKKPETPAATVIVTQPVTASEPSRQAARICTSRRSFRIRIRSKRRDPVVGAVVSVNGKTVRTLKGKRVTAPVVLRGLPKGRFLVKITATTRKGRKISGTRRYLTCTPKSKRQTIPLL